MAVSSVLPTYQRYINGAPVTSSGRKTLRLREKYIVLLVLGTFVAVCIGTFFFLPELRSSSINTAYRHIRDAGSDLLLPPPPHYHDGGNLIRHHDVNNIDPHKVVDRAKLILKIQEDLERERQKNLKENMDKAQLENPLVKNNKLISGSSTKSHNGDLLPQDQWINNVAQMPMTIQKNDFAASELNDIVRDHAGGPGTRGGEPTDLDIREKRNKIKEMMKHAWDNYVQYAWGQNELRPLSKRGHSAGIFGKTALGATIVDGLNTLYIMELYDDYQKGRDWIAANLNFDQGNSEVSVFETNIRFIGGLLSCYAMTGDVMFKEKADQVAQKLLPAFNTPTGIPYAIVNLKSGASKNYAWASSSSSILAEFGTLHLEFTYLSDITGNPIYREKVNHIRDVLAKMDRPQGLFPNYLNPKTGRWGQHHMSMGALGDSFYEYLLKSWIQSNGEDMQALQMLQELVEGINDKLVQTSKSGLKYLADLKYDKIEHKMDHLACFSGGFFAMGSEYMPPNRRDYYLQLGKDLTHTCHEAYDRTATKIGPESFRFSDASEARALKQNEKYYIQRPEVIESYFILWRVTKDPKYRQWGWEAAQAIDKHCRVDGGFTGLKNVYMIDSAKDDVQQSFFLAETLKYLYLLFSEDDLIPLDIWVLNTEAHPLPIKGKNPAYKIVS
ncbi:mannosyl-oligosaccharide 1,2-alpha-mannosidase IA-like [Stegodyphus dumicola]|uniref:mannosyl-oligosaccharide 1,2-alpha-mannosidase IA-like n=1 Tax=Stegodyphus dumicola TaxID=202533 RepID=UPI0015A87AB5|nr:mannosyl-oligosaccharide 1,2-alpha-mannosidase IA-like [Stegodyphus dumicola]